MVKKIKSNKEKKLKKHFGVETIRFNGEQFIAVLEKLEELEERIEELER